MIEAIESARRIHGFDLWAYAIMPEHVHLLIHPRGEYQIDRILTSIKRPVARKAVAWLRKRAPTRLRLLEEGPPAGSGKLRFWQRGGGYDRNLWSPDYVWQTIDYIHANPIRRGLCDAAHQWRWSSAADYLGIENGLRSLDTESLPDDSRRRS